MKYKDNKEVVKAMIGELNRGNVEEAIAFTHLDCKLNGEPFGREGDRIRTEMFMTAFPDQVWTINRLIAEGEWVSACYTFKGTFLGKMGDFPPNGQQVTFTGVTHYRIVGGQCVEAWEFIDRLVLYQQMGLIPAMA